MAHLPLVALNLLLSLSAIQPANGAILRRSRILLPLPILLINLNQPIIIRTLILPLVPPFRHPLARGLIVNRLPPPLLIRQLRTGPRTELPNPLLPRKQLPLRRRLGLGQWLVSREGGRRGGES